MNKLNGTVLSLYIFMNIIMIHFYLKGVRVVDRICRNREHFQTLI